MVSMYAILLVFDGQVPTYVAIHSVAETNGELLKFLEWYSAAGNEPNISILAMQGLPSGRGRKGGHPKRKRTKESKVPETFVSVNNSPPLRAPPPQAHQSQGHCSGSVNFASGAASNALYHRAYHLLL